MTKPRLDQGPDYERGFVDGMQYQMQTSVDKAVNAMSQQGEPVAWMYICDGDEAHPVLVHTQKDWTRASWWHEVPLYTTPPKREWVGLTKEDIDYLGIHTTDTHPEDFIRYVEAKLKEKNYD